MNINTEMIPAGYIYKKVLMKPDWLDSDTTLDIYSVSACISKNFIDCTYYGPINGFSLFDSPDLMLPMAKEEEVDLAGTTLFYYEIYPYEYDEEFKKWETIAPEDRYPAHVRIPENKFLQGFDVVCRDLGCSPLSAARNSRLNLQRMAADLTAARQRLSLTWIERLDWQECISRYDRPNTLFYVDPPYHGMTGYGMDFDLEQYERMAELARTVNGKMIISVNDTPEMRQAFAGLEMQELQSRYTLDRNKSPKAPTGELLIRNFK